MNLVNNNDRAAQGVGDESSPNKSETARGGEMVERSADAQAASATTGTIAWDPYQVWLTRVKQPRDQQARRQSRTTPVEAEKVPDLSETARLRILSAALQR